MIRLAEGLLAENAEAKWAHIEAFLGNRLSKLRCDAFKSITTLVEPNPSMIHHRFVQLLMMI
jgi:hypothetical protein